MKFLVINGPNLNLLGLREPAIYGSRSFTALQDFIRASAAKNWKDVGVVTAADQYAAVLAELKAAGKLSDKLRFALSVAAFNRIAQYDGAISDYLSSVQFEDEKLSENYVPERALFPGQSNGHFIRPT